jgi:hypothetical protein
MVLKVEQFARALKSFDLMKKRKTSHGYDFQAIA